MLVLFCWKFGLEISYLQTQILLLNPVISAATAIDLINNRARESHPLILLYCPWFSKWWMLVYCAVVTWFELDCDAIYSYFQSWGCILMMSLLELDLKVILDMQMSSPYQVFINNWFFCLPNSRWKFLSFSTSVFLSIYVGFAAGHLVSIYALFFPLNVPVIKFISNIFATISKKYSTQNN